MRSKRTTAVCVAATVLAAAACGSRTPSGPGPAIRPTATAAPAVPSIAAAPALPDLVAPPGTVIKDVLPASVVTLVDPGQEPRSQLRYSPHPGITEVVELVNDAAPLPRITLRLAFEILSVDDHWIAFRALAGDVDAELGVTRYRPRSPDFAKSFEHAALAGVMDRQGNLEALSVALPEDGHTELAWFRASLVTTIPVPSEPVGIGATWNVRTTTATMQWLTTYTLASVGDRTRLTGTRVYERVNSKEVKPPQTWTASITAELDPDQLGAFVHGEGETSSGTGVAMREVWDAIIW